MKVQQALIVIALSAAPLLAFAQNTNTPGGQASTGTPLEQTKTSSQKPAFDKSTATKSDGTTDTTAMKKPRTKTKNTTPSGDVPTYPAPAPDGTPTK